MGSHLREGSDMFKCKECGTKFDLTSASRKKLSKIGSFSPMCGRCSKRLLKQEEMVSCTMCCYPVDVDKAQYVTHIHPDGESGELPICSQECVVMYVKSGREPDWFSDSS